MELSEHSLYKIFSAFAAEQEQKWRRVEYDLRKQIAQLEAVVQHDLKDKDSVLQRAASERSNLFILLFYFCCGRRWKCDQVREYRWGEKRVFFF